jgi:hypothetical protein
VIARMGFAVAWLALPFLWPCMFWASVAPLSSVAVALAAASSEGLVAPPVEWIRALLLVSRSVVQQGPSTSDPSFLPPD